MKSLARRLPLHRPDHRRRISAERTNAERAASLRHAARAGGDAAGMAAQAARHVPAAADAEARDRHVGRAHARVHRRSRVRRDHRAGNICRSTPHHLRVFRYVCRREHTAGAGVRATHRARRNLAGRHLRGAAIHEEGRRRRRTRSAGRALGRRTVADAQDGRRRAQAARHRHQPIDGVCILGRSVER